MTYEEYSRHVNSGYNSHEERDYKALGRKLLHSLNLCFPQKNIYWFYPKNPFSTEAELYCMIGRCYVACRPVSKLINIVSYYATEVESFSVDVSDESIVGASIAFPNETWTFNISADSNDSWKGKYSNQLQELFKILSQ